MADDGDELRINAALLSALDFAPEEGTEPPPTVVLAVCIHRLALETGLVEREDPEFSWVAQAIPGEPLKVLQHFVGGPAIKLGDDDVRDGLYDALLALADDAKARKALDKKRSMTRTDILTFSQIYWNLEADGRRTELPIRSGQKLSSGLQARIKAPYTDEDLADLDLKVRAARTPGYTSDGGGYYARGARIAVLLAHQVALNGSIPSVGGARFRSTRTGRGVEWSIVWPASNDGPARVAVARLPSQPSLESAVAEAVHRIGTPPDLSAVTSRTGTLDPARFLSGASLAGVEVSEYAVSRRVDIAGQEFTLDELAARLTSEATVGYLIAGAGEGKSTYLHALCSSLTSRAIVFRWRVSGQLDWPKLQTFRDVVASAGLTGNADQLPIVIVRELATKPTREQEDALIEIVQEVPSGLTPSGTSIVLAGRPAWLNRLRRRVTTGQTIRLMPLSDAEAGVLIENLREAYESCLRDRGKAWTQAHFPNLGHFLSLPHPSQVKVFSEGSSLVGSLLHAAYGREFLRRLRDEYHDLNTADRAAYLLVSLATSAIGGISEELLESICPDANIERSSAGSPWQRDVDSVHTARHEMIGKLVVEDKKAASGREISHIIGRIVEAAITDGEARDLFLNAIRIYDDPRSLVPGQQRKSERQFRGALRSGIVNHRDLWEEFENTIGPEPIEYMNYSYILHRLLKGDDGSSGDYILARSKHLLTLAEAGAEPDSPLANRARFHRVMINRDIRLRTGDSVDDLGDFRALVPMMNDRWPGSLFYAQVVSLGLSALRGIDIDGEESDRVAQAVLEAWQRLRLNGDTRELVYQYAPFVARRLYDWPQDRRLSLLEAAWEFSRALRNPDGALACLIDDELIKLDNARHSDPVAEYGTRRRDVLALSVVSGQDDAEVVLRYAEFAGPSDEAACDAVRQAGGELATSADDAATRSMALHALAIVAASDETRLLNLRAALTAYEQSMLSRDDWLTRAHYWKRALRELRRVAPNEAAGLEAGLAAAGRKFSI